MDQNVVAVAVHSYLAMADMGVNFSREVYLA